MAQVLIVYATRYGQTEKIARRMAQRLGEFGHAVQLADAEQPPPDLSISRFDVALLGGPVYAGRYPRALVRFARQHRSELERVRSAFFSVSLAVASRTSDGRAQTQPLIDRFMQETGWRPARFEMIAGALTYSQYNFLIRFVMRSIARKEGGETDTSRDYEYTDWPAVERFALDFVQASTPKSTPLGAAPPAP